MQFKYTLNILLFGLLAIFALVSGDTEEENQLVIKAEKAFLEKDFEKSTSLFSQLLSSYPKNTNYNYKYGASLLNTSPDKASALKYLQYAVTNNERDSLSLFYLAKAYHINFYFDDAIDYYQKFNSKLPAKYRAEFELNDLITQCKFAKEIIEDIQLIKVLERKTVKADDFFRTYRLGSLERKIIIVPDEFRSAKDKKLQHQSLIVHNPNNDEIYFSSYGKKGDKGKDIYKVTRYPNGNFSEPINLGMNINTSSDEDYPYLHPTGKILYFASKGHNSIGGYDIFRSELNESTNTWGKAENLGFTINSPDDDFLYISDRQEDIAYFSSTRNNKLGELTLFKILPQQGNNAVILVQGTVKTKNGIIPSNPIIIKNLQTGELIGEFLPNPKSGEFIATLPHLTQYSLEINHIGETTRSELALPNANQNKMVAHDILIDDETGIIEISENRITKVKKEDVAIVYRRAARMDNLYGKDVEFDNPKALAQVREEVNLPPRDIAAGFKKDNSKFEKSEPKNNELNEIRKQQEQLNTQIKSAYAIASAEQKKVESLQFHKTELEKKLASAKSESEKEIIEDEIVSVQNKISIANKESVKAIKIAKQKEQLVEKSVQQEKITEKYLQAIENAEKSGNSNQAITELEKVMKDLDMAKAEFKTQEVEINKIFEKDLEQKRADLLQQDFKVNKLEMQLEELEEERISLENQMIQTKNKALLDELKLQQKELTVKINETNTELKKMQLIKALFVSEVASLESGELVAEEELIANLMENNYTETEKKAFTQELNAVKANKETAAFKEGKTEGITKADNKNQEVDNFTSPSMAKTPDTSKQNKDDNIVVSPKVESYQRYADEAEKELARLQAIQNQKTELQNSINNRDVSSVEVAKKLQALFEEEKQVNERLQKMQAAFIAPQNLTQDEQKTLLEIEEKQLQAQNNRIESKLDIHKNFVENIEKKMLVNEELASGEGIFVHAEMNDKLKEIEKLKNQNQSSIEDKKAVNNRVLALQNELDVLQNEMMNILVNHEKQLTKNAVVSSSSSNEKSLDNINALKNEDEVNPNKEDNLEENTLKFNPNSPSTASLTKANRSLGTEINLDFNYGIAPDVKRNLEEAENKNILAAKKYYEADSLKNTLGTNSKKDKKTQKRIDKLLLDAKNEQLNIQESYAKVNASEYANLVSQVQYSIDEGFVANKNLDSAVNIQKSAANLIAQAKEIRQKSSKSKKNDDKQKLNNQAYQLEIQALSLQNIVVQGELDESKPKEENISYVVNTKSTNSPLNSYNKKAAEFRAQAQKEDDPVERNRLMNLARQYELAGDEQRTERIIEENNILKNQFEVRKEFVETAQQNSKQNTTANKAFELEKESESIFAQANDLMKKSIEETDKLKQIELINQATDLYTQSNNKQNEAIKTYQQSANESENSSVKLAFDKKPVKKSTLATEQVITQNTPASQSNPAQKIDVLPMETMDEDPEEIMKAYTSVLEEAKKIEKNEANRIDEIKRLLEEARRKNLQYEKMLAEMQNIKDDDVLDQKFAEANAIREEAEKLELQAKKEEEYLKNNMAEAQSKRMEASLIQQAMDEQTKMIAQQKDKESQSELDKINNFAEVNNSSALANNNVTKSNEATPKSNSENSKLITSISNVENNSVNSTKLLDDYQRKINEVSTIEQKEVERLDKLMTLRNQSNKKKQDYETLLQQVDKMTDPLKIQEQITKADKLREEAEKLDVEIKNEEEIMRNNLAESKSKRQEAAFLLDVMDNETKSQALAQDKKILDNKEKLDNYMAKQTVVLAGNKNNTISNVNSTNKKSDDPNIKKSFTDIKTKESQIVMEDKGILGGYSEDELQITGGFTLNGPATKEILVDPPMPPGLFFKVQVGAFKNKIDPSVFQGITPINGETTSFGVIRYTAGLFRGYKAANMAKGRIRNIGFRDAFVVAFYNGKRITLAEAQLLLDQANESEKLVYESVISEEVDKLKALGIKESEADAVTLTSQRESLAVRVPNSNDNRLVNSTIGTSSGLGKNSTSSLSNNSNSQSSLAQTSISLNERNDLFYTVQIGAFGAPRTSQQLYNIDPLYSYVTERGLIKYSTGVYSNYFEANQRKKEVVSIGPKDAYVVAYQNGQTVAVQTVRPITDNNLNTNVTENSLNTSISNTTNSNVTNNNASLNEVVFRVQVGAYKAPINPKTTPFIKELESYGVQYTSTATGLLIYTIGNLKTKAEADELNVKVKEVGIKDAYVVAFKDGKRISIQEALKLNK